MSSVVNLRSYVDPSRAVTLVLIDMQQEYLASPRFLAIPHAAQAVANCRAALAHARAIGAPVAFVRWRGRSSFFNAATRFAQWIEGFQPGGSDMVFERAHPSCYASAQFADVMSIAGGHLVLAGLAGEVACLATAIDAFHREHPFTFLADASASHPLAELSADTVHHLATEIIGLYGETMTTESWIASTSRQTKAPAGATSNGQVR